ncbi:MAG: response regulator [Chloroflexi bacterium]|nr:MAG: response regulator [Chloroflexota bacterium]
MSDKRIFIVEDENVVALDIQRRLKRLGYQVAGVASTGETALSQLSAANPDLVLMDIKLKGSMDGVTTAERVRNEFEIPIVYLTAFADGPTIQRASLTEPYGYLLKPLEERELHSTIEIALYKHKMEQQLKEKEQLLYTTLRSIGDAVIATDAGGHITFMNPLAEKLTGWTQADAMGRPSPQVFNINYGANQQPATDPIAKVLAEKVLTYLENDVVLIAKDGTQTPIDDSAAPIQDEHGHTVGVVLIFRDISGRKTADEQLRHYTKELEIRNQELDAFAHTVAHDLQSPLAPIVGIAEVLQENFEDIPPEEIRKYLGSIVRNGRKMANIIEELMLLAQLHQKNVTLQPLNMAQIVSEALIVLLPLTDEYRARISVPDDWPAAMGYAPWVEEIWINYISNAIKYGGHPPKIKLGAEAAGDGSVRFWVRDNGDGLSKAQQAELFTPFTQLSQVRAKGHGLGLSIVYRILQKLGGTVAVSSAGVPGQGCEFSFTLPAAPPQ